MRGDPHHSQHTRSVIVMNATSLVLFGILLGVFLIALRVYGLI